MIVSIWGQPSSGKTTLFELLTSSGSHTVKDGALIGVARVPDRRVGFLSNVFNPRKTTYASIEFRDIPRYHANSKGMLKASDGIVLVVGAYNGGRPDLDDSYMELVLSDLEQVERSLERLKNGKFRPDRKAELEILERLYSVLSEGRPAREAGLSQTEWPFIKDYGLLTMKPLIVAVNISEEHLADGGCPDRERLHGRAEALGAPVVQFAGTIEKEIAAMSPDDQAAFMAEYGLSEPGIDRICRAAYEASGLISFFTVGEDEVRAWPIRKGSTAKEAAGKIHSDIERGFIRAEVFSFDDLEALGSVRAVKEAGRLRLESKDYVVKDGDICSFRFNV